MQDFVGVINIGPSYSFDGESCITAAGKKALAIMTISDCPFTGEVTSSQQRQTAFTDMMKVALSLAEKQ